MYKPFFTASSQKTAAVLFTAVPEPLATRRFRCILKKSRDDDENRFHIRRSFMIILIAGSTHAGKTLFAQKLLEAYSYPYLSIDHLKMG